MAGCGKSGGGIGQMSVVKLRCGSQGKSPPSQTEGGAPASANDGAGVYSFRGKRRDEGVTHQFENRGRLGFVVAIQSIDADDERCVELFHVIHVGAETVDCSRVPAKPKPYCNAFAI